MSASPDEVTRLLHELKEGSPDAVDRVLPLVYAELRSLAGKHLRRESPAHTLQPTALVHEAYLRMLGQDADYDSRVQFLGVASTMMRRILVDHARAKRREKRGAGRQRVELTESVAVDPEAEVDLLALDEALGKLAALDQRKVRLVELRYFGGMTIEETAAVLGVSPATVSRDWWIARLWLLRELGAGGAE